MALDQTSASELENHLHQLRIFLSVAEAKNVSRASEQLFKSPSAVTRSVLELERSAGSALFERWSGGMLINVYGEAVLLRARRIRDEIDQAADEVMRAAPRNRAASHSAVVNILFSGRKLQLLIHLADLGLLTSAASQMGLTQAGASMALARIESGLGQRLFERRMAGVAPTDLAERLILHAKRVLAELRHLRSDLAALSGTVAGSVVIGTTALGRTHCFPSAIAAAISNHPDLQVTAVESAYDRLIGGVHNGELDMLFGLLRPPQQSAGLIMEGLFTDRMAVLARAGHPLAERTRLDPSELLSAKWILPRGNAPGRPLVDDCFERLGLKPPAPSVQSGDLATIRQLLRASDMLAVASPHQFVFEIESGLLTELPLKLGGTGLKIGIVVREGALLSPAALAVIEAVRSAAR